MGYTTAGVKWRAAAQHTAESVNAVVLADTL